MNREHQHVCRPTQTERDQAKHEESIDDHLTYAASLSLALACAAIALSISRAMVLSWTASFAKKARFLISVASLAISSQSSASG
jgi:hypothetical protein